MSDLGDEIAKEVIMKGPIKKSFDSVFEGLNEGFESLDALGKYTNQLKLLVKGQVENIKLLGMTAPIPLSEIYFPTHISTTIARRLYEQEWLQASQGISSFTEKQAPTKQIQKGAILPADEFIENHGKVVILGGPGAGKTTFLKFIALAYSQENIKNGSRLKKSKVPIFISLPEFSKSGKEIFEYILEPLKSKTDKYATGFLKRIFEKNYGVILLDSLDEVPIACRSAVISNIRKFEQLYPNVDILISCRLADYEDSLENFQEVEIARLSKSAIHTIVKAWFNNEPEKSVRLLKLIDNDNGIGSLTETPLLLSLLCIQYRHDLNLPKRKVELYQRCVDTFLREWDASRDFKRDSKYEKMSDDRKERLFENIAGDFFTRTSSYRFPKKELRKR